MSDTPTPKPQITILLDGHDYLKPYLERELAEAGYGVEYSPLSGRDGRDSNPSAAIALAGVGQSLPEGFTGLQFPAVVATGMQGTVRALAEDVARGNFFKIRDYEYPAIHVVHATDIARAVATIVRDGLSGQWSLHDGARPSLDALADALAQRMNGKRLFALPKTWARLLGVGRKWRNFSDSFTPTLPDFSAATGLTPTNVCHYLKSHIYDENSL